MRPDLYQEMYSQEEYYWWHLAKRRLVKAFLPRRTGLKIIDTGCGTGKLLEELKRDGQEAWGIDSNPAAVKFCKQRGLKHVYQENFPQITKITDKFNVVLCLDVLEHIGDDIKALRTIKRLLAKDGRALLTVPAYPWLFSYWDKILGHKRRYTKKSLQSAISKSGLEIIKLSYLYSFLLPISIPFRFIRGQRFKSKRSQSDFVKLPQFLHSLLLATSIAEQGLLRYLNLPFGLSLFCIVRRP